MVELTELPATTQDPSASRTAAHTHISGLGLTEAGTARPGAAGFTGQAQAREACGVVVDLIKAKRFSGKAILLAGPPGSGKTALALAISRELGPKIPFTPIVGSELFSREVSKTELLREKFRSAIGLRIREVKEVYEGEVTLIAPEEAEAPLDGYGATISHVVLGLKTSKGTKSLRLDPTIYVSLQSERVQVGDVIYIESNSGIVKRVGRSDVYSTEFDLESEEYVPLPKGEVHKKKEVVQDVTLHDLDVANAGSTKGTMQGLQGVMQNARTPRGVTEKLREEVNKVVQKYIDSGTAELVPGVLFIDEVNMLDLECFTFLNRAMESPLAPVVVLASNRGVTLLREGHEDGSGSGTPAAHGCPPDLIDRLLIVRTLPYTESEISQIVARRARVENVELAPEALVGLALTGAATSLRYVLQLLAPARILAGLAGRTVVEEADVEEARGLFMDVKKSVGVLKSVSGYL